MHVAETHLELVGTEALRIKEESKGIVVRQLSAAVPPITPGASRPAIVLSEDSETQSTYIHIVIGNGIELIHT
jgi:hypothetical protein